MKNYVLSDLSATERDKLCQRNADQDQTILSVVRDIEAVVQDRGDEALREYAKRFDGADLQSLEVSPKEWSRAEDVVSQEFKEAVEQASRNITTFHSGNFQEKGERIETQPGVACWQEFRPIQKVGLYIPGGTAALVSTVMMLAIPARIAGCQEIVICTPPQADGSVAPEILSAAKQCGVTKVFKVGGAQAIFAMAYGTESVPKVNKIFGPGNQFVTTAKMLVSSHTAIDMPAGPSEVLVIADEKSNPAFIASDLLSQAEHGADSQAVLLCTDSNVLQKSLRELERQKAELPRSEAVEGSLSQSFAILCGTTEEAVQFSNAYAPEHLILHAENWKDLLPKVQSAGSVFCGPYSPESAGDYLSGTNHTLPTSGFAKSFSGVSVESFGKRISFQSLTKEGIQTLTPHIATLANVEGLDAHRIAAEIRCQ